ncbi:MAG: 16S rRNA (guanine(966)-N(2))-methyltransferase RsmD [Planctomycetota bacterium]|jgi:16S rRNA (guanine966-N2)-methyltransferase
MRIIAGTKRGMKLLSPKGYETTRPITDRVKESLFNVLYNYDMPHDKIVADLFCGTGSLGLESLSRGAKKVTFVEKDAKVVEILKRNVAKAGFVRQSKVIRANVLKVGAAVSAGRGECELVFVDPPYKMTEDMGTGSAVAGLLEFVCEQAADEAIVVVRTHRRVNLLDEYSGLKVVDRRQWGTMAVTFLRQDR